MEAVLEGTSPSRGVLARLKNWTQERSGARLSELDARIAAKRRDVAFLERELETFKAAAKAGELNARSREQ